MKKKILIAGGTGLLGNAVREELLLKGHEVRILTRNQEKINQEGFFHYNMKENQIDDKSIDQLDVLINLAGANVIEKPWTIDRKHVLKESRIGLNHFLLNVLKKAGQKPELVISASAVGIYGDGGDKIINEQSGPGAESFIVNLCKEWENSAEDFSELGSRVVLARISNVISRTDGFFPKIMESTKFGLLPVLGNGRQYVSWIHIDDLSGLVSHCIQNKTIAGAVNFCTQNAVRYEALVQTIKRVKRKSWISPKTPKIALKLMLGERAHLLFDSLRCQPQKALDNGFTFQFPDLRSAIESL